jgi:dTDP-glucose pyrophosphorylase
MSTLKTPGNAMRIADLANNVAPPSASMRAIMEQLNSGAVEYKFMLVCSEGHLLGTVTDGDIRRALLRGVSMDDAVGACMKERPLVGKVGCDAENLVLLNDVAAARAFLPIIDADGRVEAVLVNRGKQPNAVALIMAGGLGKRLGERTRHTPKPLLPVGGKPILGHILDRIESANIESIYISTHYLADKITDYLASRKGRLSVEVLREDEPLGTAGSIGLLPDSMPRPLLVINGDIVTNLDFPAFQDFHLRHKNDATIAVAQHQVTIPFGIVRTSADGQFFGIDEKPTLTHFVSAGIYLLSPEFRSLTRASELIDMPALLERGRQIGLSVGLFPIHEYWTDVGRPEDLENAQLVDASQKT